VYHYGTRFYGSPHAAGVRLSSRVVGIAALSGGGYVEATRAGKVYTWTATGVGGIGVGDSGGSATGPFYLDTTATQGSCQGIRLGSDFYPTGQGASADGSTCTGPPTQPHVLVLDDGAAASAGAKAAQGRP
jgi:hypothetical protein